MNQLTLSRRSAIAALSASTLAACAPRLATTPASADAAALLERIAWQLLAMNPETATSLGVDTGDHASLRSKLGDRSQDGQRDLVAILREGLRQVDAIRGGVSDPQQRTNLAVVRSAFTLALDGLALPYGDVAVGGWRNTPYVVIQNVGAYLDTPRFLDSDHPVRDAADAEAYLARLALFQEQLDGEHERLRAAGAMGLVAPSFLLDKAIRQMQATLAEARGGGSLVDSLVKRSSAFPGDWRRRARAIVTGSVVPALERQLAELTAQRARATSDAGM